MNYHIITGASRGIGEAVAKKLMVPGNHLLCIARSANPELVSLAEQREVTLDYITMDLADVQGLEARIHAVLEKIDKRRAKAISLVNNAGMLKPMRPIDQMRGEDIVDNMHVNLVAPMILTSAFIAYVQEIPADKRIINISSGAGKKPYYGWSHYCSAKAGIDLFTKCVAVEQKNQAHPVQVVSFAPGVVDTAMQAEIRSTPKEHFQDLDRFVALKEDGALLAPDEVAECMVTRLLQGSFESGALLDIRQM